MSKNRNFLRLEDRIEIQELLENGHSTAYIADKLKRSKNTIHNEVKRNRHLRAYNAILEQKESDVRREEHIKVSRVHIASARGGMLAITDRITALEMQIQILTELIRGKNGN